MDTVLITGGAGFLGSHLTLRICDRYRVRIFDNFHRDSLQDDEYIKNHPNIEIMNGDVLSTAQVKEAVAGCSIVVHMAAIAGVTSYYDFPYKTLVVNTIGTYNVLECCKGLNIKKFIDFSTSEVYGAGAFDVTEESYHNIGPINDLRWTYATSKLASENLMHRYGEEYGFKTFSVRPFNIYGPKQRGEGAIANFIRAVIEKRPIEIYGDGASIRAWCYVDDLIDAVETIIENDDLKSDVFNIGNPRETYSNLSLARVVVRVTESSVPIEFKDVARTDIRVRVPNIDKARRLLHFEPKVDIYRGLELTYRYFLEEAKG